MLWRRRVRGTRATDARDAALLARMTLHREDQPAHAAQQGHHDRARIPPGRPNISAEELARNGIGFQMSAFEFSAKDINRIQRIAVKESRLGIPVVFATDIIHGYWTVFPVPLGLAATFDAEDARVAAKIAGIEGYSHGQRWTFAPMVDHPADPRWGRVVETFGESPLVSQRLRRRHHPGISQLAGGRCRALRRPRISASRAASSITSATARRRPARTTPMSI